MNNPDNRTAFRITPGILALLALAVFFAAYWPALRGGFIWDDDRYLTQNPLLSDAHGLWKIWFSKETDQYYPMVFTSFWLEKSLWGLNPLGYHFVNIILHAANACLLGLILARLKLKSAWLIAGIFALHPVHVESVAWITERKNVLSGFFFLLSLLSWLRYEEKGKMSRYAMALAAFVLALFSKTVACSLPVVILLLRWMRGEKWNWKVAVELAPFFISGLGMGLVTVFHERGHVGASGAEWNFSIAERLILAGRIPWFYVSKLVFPLDLMFIYPRWKLDAGQIAQWLPAVGLVALSAALWLKRNAIGRAPLAALVAFIVVLFPALGFFNVYPMRYSFVADHFQYLASIAALCLIVEPLALRFAGSDAPWSRTGERSIIKKSAAIVILCLLAALTWKQGWIYASEKTVWEDTAQKNPGAIIAYNNLGAIYMQEGNLRGAEALFRHITSVMPDNAEAHHNLGDVYIGLGDLDSAAEHLRQSMALNPELSKPHLTLGRVRAMRKDFKGAEEEFRTALRLEPGSAEAIYNLGLLYYQMKNFSHAELYYLKALEANPNFLSARFNLGGLYFEQKSYQKALTQFTHALVLAPQDPQVAAAVIKTQAKISGD